MYSFLYLVLLLSLLLWPDEPAYAQTPADTVLARQYYQTADSLTEQGKYNEANELFRRAQRIHRTVGNWEKYIACLNSIAYNLWPVSAYDSATAMANQALRLSERYLGANHPEAARAYDVLGIVQEYRGKYAEALNFYRRSLQIRKTHYPKVHPHIADSYENLGLAAYLMGSYDTALAYHQRVLSIRLAAKPDDLLSLTYVYNNLGIVYNKKGIYNEALMNYQKALTIRRKLFGEAHPSLVSAYNNLGEVYRQQGIYNQSLVHCQKALDIGRKLFGEINREVAVSHLGLGSAYTKKGAYKEGLMHYQKALTIYLNLFDEIHPEVAIAYNNLGTAYVAKGAFKEALAHYHKALAINRNLFGEAHHEIAVNYTGLGMMYENQSVYKQAITHYEKALNVELELYGKTHPRIASSYNRLGRIHQLQGKHEQALNYYRKSMVANGISLPTPIDSSLVPTHYLDGNALLRTFIYRAQALAKLNHDSLSFLTYQLADRLLNKSRKSYWRRDDKVAFNRTITALYEGALQVGWQRYQTTRNSQYYQDIFYFSERSKANLLIDAMSRLEAQRFGLVSDTLLVQEAALRSQQAAYQLQLTQAPDSSQLRNQLFTLDRQYDSLSQKLETQYPDYYQLKYATRTATVPDIQAQLVPDEAVVSYFIGDSTYYAFAITSEHFQVVPLLIDTLLSERITSLRQMLSTDSIAPGEYQQTAYELYRQLLAPVVANSAFASVKKLTIIPDGVLGYLPFELLLTQPLATETEYATLPYLLRYYTIRYGYSATWLFHPFSRPKSPATDQYIAFAPHYPATVSDTMQQLAFGRFRDQVAPLRWNQQEVESIGQHLSGVGYTQQAAVERRFKEEAKQYRIVHLAMHALVDDRNPMDSRLVFSQDTADTLEDGYLNAYELYDMEIPAELVVLSACETGYGKLERGEGIMSLARAFAYAGCPSIVMSHWLVDDKSSAQLMDYFYRYLSNGLPKDEALRQAKLAYLETASVQKTHPLFWANFVLVGDTAPIASPPASTQRILYAVGALLLLLGLVGTAYRFRYRLSAE